MYKEINKLNDTPPPSIHIWGLSMTIAGAIAAHLHGQPIRRLTLLSLSIVLASCGTFSPKSFTDEEIHSRVAQDRAIMYEDQEPITAPITFHEAAARALKYNLDYRLKLMEDALAQSLHDVSNYEMLPRVVAGAGYLGRNNSPGGSSVGIKDNVQSLRPSTSQEREHTVASLGFSWNALDFGVSYYRAQQKADQVLMADERRRKVVQNVLQDVRNSYWRALGAQKLINQVDALIGRVEHTLERARQVEKEGLLPQAEVLAYQRALLDAINLLTLRRQDLELSRAELSALMSVPPGTQYTLANEMEQNLPAVPTQIDRLEHMALERRPEIMEEWYRKRVTENDIKAAKLLLWPNFNLDSQFNYDSNQDTYNAHWIDTGLRLSGNILKLAQYPALKKAHEYQNATDDMRRMALSMAVLTQVRVGIQRYALSLSELNYAEESLRVDQRLLDYSKAAAQSRFDSELEVIRSEARALLTEYQRYVAYSNAQAAWGRVYNSVGLDVLPKTIESHDVKTLASSMQQTMQSWQSSVFVADTKPPTNVPMRMEP